MIRNTKNKIKLWLILFFSFFGIFLFSSSVRWQDLLDKVMDPSINMGTTITDGSNNAVKSVWQQVFEGSNNTFVRITRIILWLTIALSITMILYNWLMYIIQTWQWKEWKELTKNIAFIIIWIIIAIFSVVIITLIQSSVNTFQDTFGDDSPLIS